MKLQKILFLLSLLYSTNLIGQSYQVDMCIANSNEKSQSSGAKMLEYNGYSLEETLSLMLRIPKEFIDLDESLEDFPISIKVSSSGALDSEGLKKSILNKLGRSFDIKAELTEENRQLYVITIVDERKLKTCVGLKDGIINKVTLINRTWKAQCVQISNLIEQLYTWYGINITNEVNIDKQYDFNIQDYSFQEVVAEIEDDYGLRISLENRTIEILKLKKE